MSATSPSSPPDSAAHVVGVPRLVRLEDVPEIPSGILAKLTPTADDWHDALRCMRIMRWNMAVRAGIVKPNLEDAG